MIFETLSEKKSVRPPRQSDAGGDARTNIDNNTVSADVGALKPAHRYDKHIWGAYIMLCLISIVELYSASSREISATNIYAPLLRHMMHLGIGFFIIISLQRIHYRKFYFATPWIVLISILAMVYTLINGEYVNGARRSFSIIIMSVQPAEFLKFSAVLLVAYILCRSSKSVDPKMERWLVIVCAGFIGLFGGMLFSQGLTNTLLLMAISMSMMLVAAVKVKRLAVIIMIFGILGGLGYMYKKATLDDKPDTEMVAGAPATAVESKSSNRAGVWESRLTNFLRFDKYNDKINDKNAQEQYSYIAQAHGGVIGVGLGNSRETSRLSLAFSDYIYAIIIEESGLIGGLFVMLLYLWLMARAATLAYRCNLVYPALLMIGMAVYIGFQAIFHMAIVTGAFPVSGQPLPLISKGGTSILVTSVAFGVMLSVSRHALQRGNRKQIREDISSLPENLQALNPSQN